MNIIQNIKDFQQTFRELNKTSQISLNDYLITNNMHPLDFLYRIGLNDNLVKDFNFAEMTNLINSFSGEIPLPMIDTEFYVKRNSVTVDFKSGSVIMNRDDVTFNKEFQEEIEGGNKTILDSTGYYYLYPSNIGEKSMTIEDIILNDSNIVKIKTAYTIFELDGKVFSKKYYEATINCKSNLSVKTRLYRAAMAENFLAVPQMIIQLIEKGKLKKENVDITWNFGTRKK